MQIPPNTLARKGGFCDFDHADGPDEYLFVHDKYTNTQYSVLVFPKAALWNWIRSSQEDEEKEQSATLTEFTNFLNHKIWYVMSTMVRRMWKILAKAEKLKLQ